MAKPTYEELVQALKSCACAACGRVYDTPQRVHDCDCDVIRKLLARIDEQSRQEELVKALTNLANEAAGWNAGDLANIGGWTNARVLRQQVDEARALLARMGGEELVRALTRLTNEAAGWNEESLAAIGGWTNARCLRQRVDEARALLARMGGEVSHGSVVA